MSAPKRKSSPWFAFYPADFREGTDDMSLAEKGAYLMLLSHQFDKGFIPNDEARICRIIGAMPDEWAEVREAVLAKFEPSEDGLRNHRMAEEREERNRIRDAKIEAGRKGGSKSPSKPQAKAKQKPSKTASNRPDSLQASTSTSTSTDQDPLGSLKGTESLGATRRASKARPSSREEFDSFFREVGLPPNDAESMWHNWEANGWTRGGQPIKDWKSAVRSWKASGYCPSQKNPDAPKGAWPGETPAPSTCVGDNPAAPNYYPAWLAKVGPMREIAEIIRHPLSREQGPKDPFPICGTETHEAAAYIAPPAARQVALDALEGRIPPEEAKAIIEATPYGPGETPNEEREAMAAALSECLADLKP